MSRCGRTFRIFVSSTFSDLKAERNALQGRVFPRLREFCESRGCQFQAIDLRWGISEEAGLDHQTMTLCLRELRRCQEVSPRPNFIVLTGDNYGWEPLPPRVESAVFERLLAHLGQAEAARLRFDESRPSAPQGEGNGWYRLDHNAVPEAYALLPRLPGSVFAEPARWATEETELRQLMRRAVVAEFPDPSAPHRRLWFQSATHQEVEAGALAAPWAEEHVFAYFRQATPLPDLGHAFPPASLEGMKQQLVRRLPPARVFTFPDSSAPSLEALCERVESDLRAIIAAELQALQSIDSLTAESQAHRRFGEERARHFVGRAEMLSQIQDYLTGTHPHPLILHGPSGCGKTALMARAFLDSGFADSGIAFLRIIGATPRSGQIRTLLEDLGHEVDRALGNTSGAIPSDINGLQEWFRQRLVSDQEAGSARPVILFLDALDQLSEADGAHGLSWLPRDLPNHVRVVVSILDRPGEPAGVVLETARRLCVGSAFLSFPRFTSADGASLLDLWLAAAEPPRRLTSTQRTQVLMSFAHHGLPFWLRIAFNEARHWHSYSLAPDLPEDPMALILQMLERLQRPERHGTKLVECALGYLAAARRGLSEEELLDLLAADDDYWQDFLAHRYHELPGEARCLPVAVWVRLHAELEPYLTEQQADGIILLGFYHRLLREVVEATFLSGEQRGWRHDRLAEYFLRQTHFYDGDMPSSGGLPRVRKITEAPYAAIRSTSVNPARWADIVGTVAAPGLLCDLRFIEAKSAVGLGFELSRDYAAAEAALPELKVERERDLAIRRGWADYAVALADHAGQRLAGGEGLPPTPPPACTRLITPHAPRDDDHARATRLLRFSRFHLAHRQALAEHPRCTQSIAANNAASGLVSEQADRWRSGAPDLWLQRAPRPPEPDLRPACLFALTGHEGEIAMLATSADFSRALSASRDDGTLRLWDLDSGACLKTLRWHGVTALAANTDCSLALCGGQTISHWDLASGTRTQTLDGHTQTTALVVSADFTRALSGSADGSLRLWDIEGGTCLTILTGHSGSVTQLVASADFSRAISVSHRHMRFWDLLSGTCLSVTEHEDRFTGLSASADFSRVLFISRNRSYPDEWSLLLWDLQSGTCLKDLQGHRSDGITALVASADFTRALSGGRDGTLRLWDLESGTCLQVIEAFTKPVTALAASADFSRGLAGGHDGTLRLWDLATDARHTGLAGHPRGATSLTAGSHFTRALSRGGDHSLRLWDAESGTCLRILDGHTEEVTSLAASSDFSLALSGSRDRRLRLWDLTTGSCLAVLMGSSEPEGISLTTKRRRFDLGPESICVVASADFSRALSGSRDKTLRLWDLKSGACLQVLAGHTERVTALAANADLSHALSAGGGWDRSLRLWDLDQAVCLAVLRGHSDSVTTLVANTAFTLALSASWDKTLRLWDLQSAACLHVFEGHSHWVHSVAANTDFSTALSGSHDGTLRLWDLRDGTCLQALKGHSRQVNCLATSPHFSSALSGSHDGTLRLWDLHSGTCLATYCSGSPVLSVVADLANGLAICACEDGQIHFVSVCHGREVFRLGS